MPETGLTKQKSLSELQYFLQHYQQVYPQAKLRGKVVLRQYFRKVNYRIHHLQFRSARK